MCTKIVLTICSNNYLAKAKVLYDSIKDFSDIQFVIGLVDKKTVEVDYSIFENSLILEVDEIGINGFSDLWKKYDIIELNTAVKPYILDYLFNEFPAAKHIFYFDPDIEIYQSLDFFDKEFDSHDIILTPHIISPIELDGKTPQEEAFLNFGIYNLGFIGLRRCDNVFNFLKWWNERTFCKGFNSVSKGLFVDQLWINLVPIFFENVKVLKHYGCNAAPWNLHERDFSKRNELYFVNDDYQLVFYHFSNLKLDEIESTFSGYSRYNFNNRKDIIELYSEYNAKLKEYHAKFSSIDCYWIKKRNQHLAQTRPKYTIFERIKKKIIRILG